MKTIKPIPIMFGCTYGKGKIKTVEETMLPSDIGPWIASYLCQHPDCVGVLVAAGVTREHFASEVIE